jgi:hypothetical protein
VFFVNKENEIMKIIFSFKDYHLKSGIAIWIHGLMTSGSTEQPFHATQRSWVVGQKNVMRGSQQPFFLGFEIIQIIPKFIRKIGVSW